MFGAVTNETSWCWFLVVVVVVVTVVATVVVVVVAVTAFVVVVVVVVVVSAPAVNAFVASLFTNETGPPERDSPVVVVVVVVPAAVIAFLSVVCVPKRIDCGLLCSSLFIVKCYGFCYGLL